MWLICLKLEKCVSVEIINQMKYAISISQAFTKLCVTHDSKLLCYCTRSLGIQLNDQILVMCEITDTDHCQSNKNFKDQINWNTELRNCWPHNPTTPPQPPTPVWLYSSTAALLLRLLSLQGLLDIGPTARASLPSHTFPEHCWWKQKCVLRLPF